jgi:hypothetical protein
LKGAEFSHTELSSAGASGSELPGSTFNSTFKFQFKFKPGRVGPRKAAPRKAGLQQAQHLPMTKQDLTSRLS